MLIPRNVQLGGHGELSSTQAVAIVMEAGFSRATVYRARSTWGEQIVDSRGRHHPGNRWALRRISREEAGDQTPEI
jgi:hypothetical protein